MDQSNHQDTNILLPLEQLIALALDQLKRLGYSKKSLYRYRTTWQHLIEFSHEKQLGNTYSETLATRFIDAYRLKSGEDAQPPNGWRQHIIFGIKVLGDLGNRGQTTFLVLVCFLEKVIG